MLSNINTCMLPRHRVEAILAISGPSNKLCNDDRMLLRIGSGTSRDREATAQCIIRTICGSGVPGVEFGSTGAYLLTWPSFARSARSDSETDMTGKRGMMRSRHVSYTAVSY